MTNPFLRTKDNNYPTYTIIPKPPKKSVSILPVEDTPQNVSDEVASSALKLETPRRISISGDATGAALFDGTADTEIRLIVKDAERATKDGNGKNISKTYAAKSDLNDYAKKSEVTEKLNYIERVLYETKLDVNEVQNELNDIKAGNTSIGGGDSGSSSGGDSGDTLSGGDTLADEDDINSLFGD